LGGRPPEKLDKAIAFIVEKLGNGERKQCDLVNEWEANGESSGTFFNALRAMQAEGRVELDNSKKPKTARLVKNSGQGQELVSDPF
jgi:hypothetical protein